MPIETLRDIPCYSEDECHFVRVMVEAIIDLDGEKDGNAHQIDAIKKACIEGCYSASRLGFAGELRLCGRGLHNT